MRLDSLDAQYLGLGCALRCTGWGCPALGGWGCPALGSDPLVAGRLSGRQAAADTMRVCLIGGFVMVSEFCCLETSQGSLLRMNRQKVGMDTPRFRAILVTETVAMRERSGIAW